MNCRHESVLNFIKMAVNNSFLKLKGGLGGLSFYEAEGENRVREKGGVD